MSYYEDLLYKEFSCGSPKMTVLSFVLVILGFLFKIANHFQTIINLPKCSEKEKEKNLDQPFFI